MFGEIEMIDKPMDILTHFPIRRTPVQKQAFRESICGYLSGQGIECHTEETQKNCHNLVVGDLSTAEYLVTAHYDTPASIGIPNVMIPCNLFFFIAYQMLVICVFFLAAFVLGAAAWLVTNHQRITFVAAYVGYFGVLLLMLYGPANRHNVNDNSSGVITLLETLIALPEETRKKVCFVLFDKEEYGLVGSKAFRKKHKAETENIFMLNLDCVGDGDYITLFPSKKLKKDPNRLKKLEAVSTANGQKTVTVWQKMFQFNSDQKNYPISVGIGAFHKKKLVGLCCGRIHTCRDTVLDEKNVITIRDSLIKLLSDTE